MYVIADLTNMGEIKEVLEQSGTSFYFDYETTGLEYYDRPFMMGVKGKGTPVYILNFHDNFPHKLPFEILNDLPPFRRGNTVYAHNAFFDYYMHRQVAPDIEARLRCTLITERLIDNTHFKYTLEACGERRKLETHKDDLHTYLVKNKHYVDVQVPGVKKPMRKLFYFMAPAEMLYTYLEKDVLLLEELQQAQEKDLEKIEDERPSSRKPLHEVIQLEEDVSRSIYRMMSNGMSCDKEMSLKSAEYYKILYEEELQKFKDMTGKDFVDSGKQIEILFHEYGIPCKYTATGTLVTDKKYLSKIEHPIGNVIQNIRHYETIRGYFENFIFYMDDSHVVHPWIRQEGAKTGRMSCSKPNLMNLPKEEDSTSDDNNVRKAFRPRKGNAFVFLDYRQQEYRMMLDYANERHLIDAVMSGSDVHDATAEILGIQRKTAKTVNFGVLYGIGIDSLGELLNIMQNESKNLRMRYFAKLPMVAGLIEGIKTQVKRTGRIYSWSGRIFRGDASTSYKLPNHLIQGGCADVIKYAIVKIDKFIQENNLETRICLPIHDELILDMPPSEFHHVNDFVEIMESIYPSFNGMILKTSVEHSFKSWSSDDKIPGFPAIISP